MTGRSPYVGLRTGLFVPLRLITWDPETGEFTCVEGPKGFATGAGKAEEAGRFLRARRSRYFSALMKSPIAARSRGANVPSTATTMLPARMVWTPESYAGVVEINSGSPTWPPLVSST